MEFQREPFPLYTPVEGTLPKPPGELVQGMLFKDSDGSHGSELRVPHNLTEFMALAGVDRVLNRHGFKFIRAQIEAILKIHRFQKAVVASPTGTGKTYLALAAAARLIQEGKRVLFVTRQVKLVEQVLENAEDVLNLGDFKKAALHGNVARKKRAEIYGDSRALLCVATGQMAARDMGLVKGAEAILDLSQFSMVIFDEIHQAKGNDCYVLMLEEIRRHFGGCKVLCLSATPAETKRDLDNLLYLLRGNDLRERVGLIKVRVDPQPKKMIKVPVPLSPDILYFSKKLYEVAVCLHKRALELSQPYPDIEREVRALLNGEGDSPWIAPENVTKRLVSQVRRSVQYRAWRDNLIEHIYAVGAVGRYWRYLLGTGKFFFLDRMGRDLVYAFKVAIRGERELRRPKLRRGSDNSWFFNMLRRNGELRPFIGRITAIYREVSEGSGFSSVLKASNLSELAIETGVSRSDLEDLKRGGSGRYKSGDALIKDIFARLRASLSRDAEWRDHPLTERIVDIVESHLRYDRAGSIIVESNFYEDALFISEVLGGRLGELYGVNFCTVAGSQYMGHRTARENIAGFAAGNFPAMASTTFIGEGHHIPGASTLIIKHQPHRASQLQQFRGRVGREGVGLIYNLLLPQGERAFMVNMRRLKEMQRLIDRTFVD